MSGMWKKLSSTSQIKREAKERAHGDGILVNYDSAEAFEEVFWRAFIGDQYIFQDHIIPHNTTRSVREDFKKFVQHVLSSAESGTQTRYLSKNNNNLLRLPTLKQAFPDSVIIIPFRNPAQQALSLLKQHQLFCERHRFDRFSLSYMKWLGHFEFGLGHKHYSYSDTTNPYPPTDIEYWLQSWLDAYNFALSSASSDTIFLGYEQLCEAPLDIFAELFPKLSLESDTMRAASFYHPAELHTLGNTSSELLDACYKTHSKLISKHNKALSTSGTNT
jgi:hypothetical protein